MKKCFIILIICFFAVGCAKYYKITDPTTEKTYYTKKVKKRGSGAVRLKDQRTGRTVTLQSSEVEKITKDQFNLGVISQGSEATQ
jgi:hypothetical protein